MTKTKYKYKYKPLQHADEIRVLDLRMNGTKLEATITHIRVGETNFQALSYEWGGEEKLFQISIRDDRSASGAYLETTSNLNHALHDLWDCPDIYPKRFWIDQLSIDQGNNLEKGHQVQYMKQIYKVASGVIVYLGPHPKDSDEVLEKSALNLLDKLYNHFKSNFPLLTEIEKIRHYTHVPEELPVSKLPSGLSVTLPSWRQLLRIVYTCWIRRLWMVQEAILCSETAMLRGTRKMNWITVASIPVLHEMGLIPTEIFSRNWSSLELGFLPDDALTAMMLTWEIRLGHEYHTGSKEDRPEISLPTLVENMTFYNALDCKDPRDRIYAVLGISSDAQQFYFPVDYKCDPYDLMELVSKQVIENEDSLYLFNLLSGRCAHITGQDQNTPSWSFFGRINPESHIHESYPHPSNKTESKIRFENDNRIMVLDGLIVDEIVYVTESAVDQDDLRSPSHEIQYRKRILQVMTELFQHTNKTRKTFHDLAICFTGGNPIIRDMEEHEIISHFFSFIRDVDMNLTKHSAPSAGLQNLPQSIGRTIRELYTDYVLLQELQEYERICEDGLIDEDDDMGFVMIEASCSSENIWQNDMMEEQSRSGRKLMNNKRMQKRSFATSTYGRIGNVTSKAKPGDKVAALAGGDETYILRPLHDGTYRFIGTAFVCGLENGTAYEGKSPQELDTIIRIA